MFYGGMTPFECRCNNWS